MNVQRELEAEKTQWVSEAVAAGRLIGLDASIVTSAFAIVLNAFGEDWLKAELPRCDRRKYGGMMAGHPLLHALRMGQPCQTSEVVELAEYLVEFQPDPCLAKVIEHMRDQQHFQNYRLPLAMGHRWRAAGAGCTLEPSVGNGQADLEAVTGNNRWIVECSNQNPSAADAARSKLRDAAFQRISSAIDSSRVPAALRIVGGPGVTDRQLTAVACAIRDLAAKLSRDSDQTFEASIGEWRIDLRKLSLTRDPLPKCRDDPATDCWDLICECKSVPRQFVEHFPKGEDPRLPGVPVSRIYLRIDGTDRELESAILRKLDKKISQSSAGGAAGLRWITIGIQEDVQKLDRDRIQNSVLERLDRHPRVLGVSICHRRYWRGRNIYDQLVWANTDCEQALPREFLERFLRVEDRIAYWFDAA